MLEVFLDALKDSAIILGFVFIMYELLSFFEPKLAKLLERNHKWSPVVGVSLGLIPQCGFSVLAADLYNKKHITIGTLVGVFIATSDEAIPIFISSVQDPKKIIMVLPLLAIKFLVGLGVAYLLDFIFRKNIAETKNHQDDCHCDETIHFGCCGYAIDNELDHEHHHEHEHRHEYHHEHEHDCEHQENDFDSEYDEVCGYEEYDEYDEDDDGYMELTHTCTEEELKKKKIKVTLNHHLVHPLVHSLKIFLYVFIINYIFGLLFYTIGEIRIMEFLSSNKYLAPLFSVIVGFIPNCASSVILSDLYLLGGITFGSCVGGLCVNAGLGLFVLFKNVKQLKQNIIVTISLLLTGLVVGYLISAIEWAI